MLLVSIIKNGGEGRVLNQKQKRCASLTKTSIKNDNKKELLDEQDNISHKAVLNALEETYEKDCEQQKRMVQELRKELSCVKESNTELISKIEELELDKESARIRSNTIMSAMEETYEKEREQHERMVKELSDDVSKLKESKTELILKIQDLELDKESARISNDAIMSAMEETYETDREQQERMVKELSNKLSKVKDSNTELILKIQDLEREKESARISSNAIMSAMEETYEKDHEQQERIAQELRNEVASIKKSNAELVKQIQDLEIDHECARISFDAIISALEENYEIDQEQYRKEVQNLQNIVKENQELNKKQRMKIEALETELESMTNESAASKANHDAEIATLKNELERVKSNCSQLCIELVEEKRKKHANIIALTSDIDEMKKKNSTLQEEKELSKELLRNIKRELQNEKANKLKAQEFVALLNNKVSQQIEEIHELTVRMRKKRGLRGLISCCF